jgi:hypothetical protein
LWIKYKPAFNGKLVLAREFKSGSSADVMSLDLKRMEVASFSVIRGDRRVEYSEGTFRKG